MKELGKWGVGSFCWSLFNWFFSSTEGPNCSGGFGQFPSFGLQALKWHWNFDFGLIYIGVGMICPHIVNASMMAGAIFSWGIMWPLISSKVRSPLPPPSPGQYLVTASLPPSWSTLRNCLPTSFPLAGRDLVTAWLPPSPPSAHGSLVNIPWFQS